MPAESAGREWFGHPPGLTILFLTEAWEKFSYYGMRAILVFYMTKEMAFSESKSSFIYGLYTAFVYLTPLIGAPVSDRWLGRQRSVLIGGLIMAAGHFMMIAEPLLLGGLATIAIGNGLYLPSLPAQVNELYAVGDPRGKRAMNVYYVGVNAGGFLAPLVCGTIGEVYGWHYGFGAAGVGMLIGLTIFWRGLGLLPASTPLPIKSRCRGRARSSDLHKCLGLMLRIVLLVVVLRAGYEQIGNTVALWSDAGVDRHVGAHVIPMTWFVSLDPLFVFLLTPYILKHWDNSARLNRERSSIQKMAIGAALIALAYFLLAAIASIDVSSGFRTHWLWVVVFFAILTAGEIFLMPVGMGLFARIAPSGFAATFIAIWLSAAFLGNFGSGLLGQLWSGRPPSHFFAIVGATCLAPAALMLLLDGAVRTAEAKMVGRPGRSD